MLKNSGIGNEHYAKPVMKAVQKRKEASKLELHPEKSRLVYNVFEAVSTLNCEPLIKMGLIQIEKGNITILF